MKEKEEPKSSSQLLASGKKRNQAKTSATVAAVSEADNWVQCNKCKKWRKVPSHIDVDGLPEKWYCSLNYWATAFALCSVKEEDYESTTNATSGTAPGANVNTPHRNARRGSGVGSVIQNVTSSTNLTAFTSNTLEVKKTQWVQCERKSCKKWRKVPEHIDMDTFPEKWYCEMNSWNPQSASCAFPEDSDSENEPARKEFLKVGQKKSSYRNIIFGADGKVKAWFSEKNKHGYGIFSHNNIPKRSIDPEDSSDLYRKVSYWWSSAFDETSKANVKRRQPIDPISSVPVIVKEENHLPEEEPPKDPFHISQPNYLLDCARRIGGMTSKTDVPLPPNYSYPKKIPKSWTLLQSVSLLTRCSAENTTIRSCFLAANTNCLTLDRLYHFIQKCKFHDPVIDACREYFSREAVRVALHRLEQRDEVEVYYNSLHETVVNLLTPLTTLRSMVALRSKVFHKKVNCEVTGTKWSKHGVPLKLRKFYDRRYRSSIKIELLALKLEKVSGTEGSHTSRDHNTPHLADRADEMSVDDVSPSHLAEVDIADGSHTPTINQEEPTVQAEGENIPLVIEAELAGDEEGSIA